MQRTPSQNTNIGGSSHQAAWWWWKPATEFKGCYTSTWENLGFENCLIRFLLLLEDVCNGLLIVQKNPTLSRQPW